MNRERKGVVQICGFLDDSDIIAKYIIIIYFYFDSLTGRGSCDLNSRPEAIVNHSRLKITSQYLFVVVAKCINNSKRVIND